MTKREYTIAGMSVDNYDSRLDPRGDIGHRLAEVARTQGKVPFTMEEKWGVGLDVMDRALRIYNLDENAEVGAIRFLYDQMGLNKVPINGKLRTLSGLDDQTLRNHYSGLVSATKAAFRTEPIR